MGIFRQNARAREGDR